MPAPEPTPPLERDHDPHCPVSATGGAVLDDTPTTNDEPDTAGYEYTSPHPPGARA